MCALLLGDLLRRTGRAEGKGSAARKVTENCAFGRAPPGEAGPGCRGGRARRPGAATAARAKHRKDDGEWRAIESCSVPAVQVTADGALVFSCAQARTTTTRVISPISTRSLLLR